MTRYEVYPKRIEHPLGASVIKIDNAKTHFIQDGRLTVYSAGQVHEFAAGEWLWCRSFTPEEVSSQKAKKKRS